MSSKALDMLENKIQRKIRERLEKDGWLVIKIISSSLNGIPDLIAHRGGETIYIETKIPGRDPDPLQEYRHKQIREHGIKVIVADSIEVIKEHTN